MIFGIFLFIKKKKSDGFFFIWLFWGFFWVWDFLGAVFFWLEVSDKHWSCSLLKSVTWREIQACERAGFPLQFLSPFHKPMHRLCRHTDCVGRWSTYWTSGGTALPGADVHILSALFLDTLIKACTCFLTKSSDGWNLSAFSGILAGLKKYNSVLLLQLKWQMVKEQEG